MFDNQHHKAERAGLASPVPTTRPGAPPPLLKGLDAVSSELQTVRARFETLAQQLSPLLRPLPPASGKDGDSMCGCGDAVTDTLALQANQLAGLCRAIDELMERLVV